MNKGLCKNLQNTERKNTGKLGVWFFTFHKSYKRCVTTQKQPKVSNASLNHWCSLHTDHCCHCHLQEKTSEFSSPDMVPTPMTRHSTRASRVKVGPRMAMPWEMFSLTSSYTRHRDEAGISDTSTTILHVKPQVLFQSHFLHTVKTMCYCTWEFELRANLANAQALDRSMRRRKNGSASLQRNRQIIN